MRGIVRGPGAQQDRSGFDDMPAVDAAMQIVAAVRGVGACPKGAQLQGLRDGDGQRQFLRVGFGQTSTSAAVGSLFVIEADADVTSDLRVAEVENVEVEQFAMSEAAEMSGDDRNAVAALLIYWLRGEFARDPDAPVAKMEGALKKAGFL